jgi:hypothetical protein
MRRLNVSCIAFHHCPLWRSRPRLSALAMPRQASAGKSSPYGEGETDYLGFGLRPPHPTHSAWYSLRLVGVTMKSDQHPTGWAASCGELPGQGRGSETFLMTVAPPRPC